MSLHSPPGRVWQGIRVFVIVVLLALLGVHTAVLAEAASNPTPPTSSYSGPRVSVSWKLAPGVTKENLTTFGLDKAQTYYGSSAPECFDGVTSFQVEEYATDAAHNAATQALISGGKLYLGRSGKEPTDKYVIIPGTARINKPPKCQTPVSFGAAATTPSCAQITMTVTPAFKEGATYTNNGAVITTAVMLKPGESAAIVGKPANDNYKGDVYTKTFTNDFTPELCNVAPTATAEVKACAKYGDTTATGSALITVTNTDDLGKKTVTYTLLEGDKSIGTITGVANGASAQLTVQALPGAHTVTIKGDDGTSTTVSYTIVSCNAPPPPPPPTYQCPATKTNPGDLNHDGKANAADCNYKPPYVCPADRPVWIDKNHDKLKSLNECSPKVVVVTKPKPSVCPYGVNPATGTCHLGPIIQTDIPEDAVLAVADVAWIDVADLTGFDASDAAAGGVTAWFDGLSIAIILALLALGIYGWRQYYPYQR